MQNHDKSEIPETMDHEKGLAPSKGIINSLLVVIFMYLGVFLLLKWLKGAL